MLLSTTQVSLQDDCWEATGKPQQQALNCDVSRSRQTFLFRNYSCKLQQLCNFDSARRFRTAAPQGPRQISGLARTLLGS